MPERNPGLAYMMHVPGGCMEDTGDCIYASCCPACHMGSIAERTNTGSCCMTAAIASCLGPFSPLYLKCVASKALESVGVKPVGYVESCSMPSCVACQVSREINERKQMGGKTGGAPTAAPTAQTVAR